MIAFVNGEFLPAGEAVVSVFDRGFLYGDGLFETMRVRNGRVFRWNQHLDRLRRGAEVLQIGMPFSNEATSGFVAELIRHNQTQDGLLRLTLSRGEGARGYSIKGASKSTVVMTMHPVPQTDPANPTGWRLMISKYRVPAGDLIARFKTCNKLHQILARAEAEAAGADEALMLNTDGMVAEAAASNIFWIEKGAVCTTPLDSGNLAGITRTVILELCQQLNISSGEKNGAPEALLHSEGVFLSLSSLGVVECVQLDRKVLKRSPLVGEMRTAYRELMEKETALAAAG